MRIVRRKHILMILLQHTYTESYAVRSYTANGCLLVTNNNNTPRYLFTTLIAFLESIRLGFTFLGRPNHFKDV